jgi:hypothetical protein
VVGPSSRLQPFSVAVCCEPMEGERPRLLLLEHSKLSSREMLAQISLKPLSLRSLHKRTLRLSRLLTRLLVSAPFTSRVCSSFRLERREHTDGRLLPLVDAVEELRRADKFAMRPRARIAFPVFYNTQTHTRHAACNVQLVNGSRGIC